MKIASPISRLREIAPLSRAGAGEFYCGVAPHWWHKKFGFVESISRRNSPRAHLQSLSDLEDLVRRSHRRGVAVHCVLNESYHQEQMNLLEDQVSAYLDAGVDGIILGDAASLFYLKNRGLRGNYIMGTGGTAFNLETISFYHHLGVNRVILPRHLKINEIQHLVTQGPPMEYEAFVFRGLCPFIDGLCRFQHGINQALGKKPSLDLGCAAGFRIKCLADTERETHKIKPSRLSRRQSLTGCGLCALWDLVRLPQITAVKIVGREFSSREKEEDLKMVAGALNLLKNNPGITSDEFYGKCRRMFREFFDRPCTVRDCYPQFKTWEN